MFSRTADRSQRYAVDTDEDWAEPQRVQRDWKKIFLVLGLGTLSWVATYVGMLELIQANMGALDLTTKVVVGFSVAMLMTMIIWLLDQMFAPHPLGVKFAYVAGYIFLTIISVGFGFGFYWKVLESRSEASRSAESAVSQVQAALLAGSSRLDQLQATLSQLTEISKEKAILERDSGTSCPNSQPGDGPRRRLRDEDAARFSFASNFVKGRSAKVKADMQALDGDLKKIVSGDKSTFDAATGTRNKFLQALSRKLELTATSFNAFRTDPQLRQIRSELAERANRTTFPTGRGNRTFSCPDGQLQSALYGVVKAIDQLPELDKPEIATVEGAQAVVEAFRRLTATGQGVLIFKLPPSADELRELQKKAVRSVTPGRAPQTFGGSGDGLSQGGLAKRDYIPLSIALFVDLCLLLVSIGRPMNRLGGLVPKMREAERGPVYQILSKFDEIHRDEKIREKFEIFRHVVFDFNGDYYVAVPLDAPRNRNPEEVSNLQLEAHLLGNLFASFEKERIFARVYNPLLSAKTIQKRLWRQGSKFAASQAFRVYRFRNGAWSDIILGAVMGAARRAKVEQARRAKEAGPQLDVPDKADAAGHDDEQLREAIAETVRERMAEAAGNTEPRRSDEVGEDAARMAAALVPNEHAAPNGTAGTNDDAASAARWPYRQPPPEPGEAQVELLPANSNTSPGSVHDNVIRMPRPAMPQSPPPVPTSPLAKAKPGMPAEDVDAPYTEALAHAIRMPEADAGLAAAPAAAEEANDEVIYVAPAPVPALTDLETTQQPAEGEPTMAEVCDQLERREAQTVPDLAATSMSVRITQRTADFEIPVHATFKGQPAEVLRAGMRATLLAAHQAENGSSEFALDLEAVPVDAGVANGDRAPIAGDVLAISDQTGGESSAVAVVSGAAGEAATAALADEIQMLPFEDVGDFEEVGPEPAAGAGALSERDLEEISRRFAPGGAAGD